MITRMKGTTMADDLPPWIREVLEDRDAPELPGEQEALADVVQWIYPQQVTLPIDQFTWPRPVADTEEGAPGAG